MARFHSFLKLNTKHPSFSPFSWLWVLLSLCVISVVVGVVGKKHSAAKSKGSGSGGGVGTCKRSAEEVAETEAEQRKKRKEDEEAARAQKQWVTNLKSKGYTCERWVDEYKIGPHEVFEVMAHHCLAFFKDEVPGFRGVLVDVVSGGVQRLVSEWRCSKVGLGFSGGGRGTENVGGGCGVEFSGVG
ncbi:hypothetical protein RHMOL_Rhmol09G0089900 [Rhododendron molle]|uniref:Uncharacterized protein n=1 Tax=Rhododendron molle TaxID=49168 RepID=A0ACC0MCK0_RHOML|nr:hypothetical protein RHMOL_Rhmol09G0089900 [Rhododendron molle]